VPQNPTTQNWPISTSTNTIGFRVGPSTQPDDNWHINMTVNPGSNVTGLWMRVMDSNFNFLDNSQGNSYLLTNPQPSIPSIDNWHSGGWWVIDVQFNNANLPLSVATNVSLDPTKCILTFSIADPNDSNSAITITLAVSASSEPPIVK
jgi:hypothetical protein